MALPLSRNTNYAAGSKVLAADLNDLQDQSVNALHGTITTVIAAKDCSKDDSLGNQSVHQNTGPGLTNVAGGRSENVCSPRLPVGAVVTEVRIRGQDVLSGAQFHASFRENDASAGTQTDRGTKDSDQSGNIQTLSFTTSETYVPFTVTADVFLEIMVELDAGAANVEFYEVSIDWYKAT